MIRTFHSIGHGGFCTEEFGDFTMVYDCGGRNLNVINYEIEHSFKKNQIIDALFISHFHRDHINGLEYLLKNYTVKRVFIPFLHDNQKIQVIVENAINIRSDSFTNNLILNPVSTIQENSKNGINTYVIYINSGEGDGNNLNKENLNIESINSNISNLDSGTPITISSSTLTYNWIFIPFNFEYNIWADKIAQALNTIDVNKDNIVQKLQTKRSQIIEVYRNIHNGENNFNSNSLTLYSGMINNSLNILRLNNLLFYPFNHYSHGHVGCLYLGDYNSKDNRSWLQLHTAYSVYWDYLSTIQIPHHGSANNYNEKLNSRSNIFSVMNVNRHSNHPHASTMKYILLNSGYPVIVTEDSCTRYIEQIEEL